MVEENSKLKLPKENYINESEREEDTNKKRMDASPFCEKHCIPEDKDGCSHCKMNYPVFKCPSFKYHYKEPAEKRARRLLIRKNRFFAWDTIQRREKRMWENGDLRGLTKLYDLHFGVKANFNLK